MFSVIQRENDISKLGKGKMNIVYVMKLKGVWFIKKSKMMKEIEKYIGEDVYVSHPYGFFKGKMEK